MTPAHRRPALALAALLCAASACNDDFFGVDSDDEVGTTDTDTGEPKPPPEGYRVFPKYQLMELSATVSVESGGQVPQACPPDELEGGYLCEVSELPGPTVTIRVERDGFAPAAREFELVSGTIVERDVHLLVAGEAIADWGDCATPGEFESCEEMCGAMPTGCLATSCSSIWPEQPVASVEYYDDPDCLGNIVSANVLACSEPLGAAGATIMGMRCCCEI
jgi:hypothetical protein